MTQQDILGIKQRFGIIGTSPILDRDIEVAVQVAATDLSVLVTGESGVGKEHFPQIIHAYSRRKHGPYFVINCGAIPEGTIDSELFGHAKGAYTDAKSERKGYFEQANGGTLFLDEVGELPLATQVRLLRVLEKGEYIRMGESEVQHTNVRVVAATNLDMSRAVAEGRFREDLYYRLNCVEIRVPALRDRKDDIPLLFRKFAADFSQKYNMPRIQLSDEATNELKNYYWYGNIRQLKNVAEQISVIETSRDVNVQTLRKYLPENELHKQVAVFGQQGGDPFMNERELLYKVLFDMKHDIAELKRQIAGGVPSAAQPVYTAEHQQDKPMIICSSEPKEPVEMAEEVRDEPMREMTPITIESVERNMIAQALARHDGNRKEAAQEIGISERTMYRKIKDYGL